MSAHEALIPLLTRLEYSITILEQRNQALHAELIAKMTELAEIEATIYGEEYSGDTKPSDVIPIQRG